MGDGADQAIRDAMIADEYSDWAEVDEYIRYQYNRNLYNLHKGGSMLPNQDVIIENARVSYLAAFEPKETPSGDMKFSVSILFPKEDEATLAKVQTAIKFATQKGLENNKFTKAHVKSLRLPVRDGTAEHEAGDRGPEYSGNWFINANSNNQPGIVQQTSSGPQPIVDPSILYSGCYCHVHISFFPYNTAGNRGIGAGFQNIMLVEAGERLDGRIAADDAFSQYAAEGENTELNEDDIPF